MDRDKMNLTDLLADESFINYCKASSPVDLASWEHFIQENPDQRELVAFAKERFLLLFNVLAEADLEEQETWLRDRLNQPEGTPVISMDARTETSPRKFIPLLLKITAAAVVLLLAGFFASYFFNPGKKNTTQLFATAYGERKSIELPDGSMVNLNAGSKIQINENFGVSVRSVYLEGEAFFDVKHDAAIPFIVHTPAMDVKALGTAFDVKAYRNEKVTETSLIRGLVEVTLKENNNRVLLLHPNQKIAWERPAAEAHGEDPVKKEQALDAVDGLMKKLAVTDHGDIKEIAWKENKLIFEDDSFNDIAALLERWYGVRIAFEDDIVRNYRFTGVFENEDIQTVLNFLKESRHFNFKMETGETVKVVLSR